MRDAVSVIASGGLARAEHVPKALLCGADAVGLDAAYVIALGMLRFDGNAGRWTPETADITDTERAHQRLVNLVNSWRDQLLEVMGAMGIREARRLQGEEGRAMFYEDLQKEFLSLFTAPALKEHDPDYG
ncbi:MAG: glutamate synthase-related protein [Elusimicrobia bacterium]|nr:glutamate synthase-related protein [Elusimicrobiota bacterium]